MSQVVGLELNLRGLNLEFDLDRPGIVLPAYGRIGTSNLSLVQSTICERPANPGAGLQNC